MTHLHLYHLASLVMTLRRYPWLDQSRRIPPTNEVEGSAWKPIIEHLLEEIDHVIGATGATFEIHQLKEKLGRLRLYYRLRDATPTQEAIIEQLKDVAVEASSRTCFRCGAAAEVRDCKGWLIAVCPEHFEDAVLRRLQDWDDWHPAP